MYSNGHATRDDYAKALQAYQAYLREIKSNDRDKAAEYDEMYKYYEWCKLLGLVCSRCTTSFFSYLIMDSSAGIVGWFECCVGDQIFAVLCQLAIILIIQTLHITSGKESSGQIAMPWHAISICHPDPNVSWVSDMFILLSIRSLRHA